MTTSTSNTRGNATLDPTFAGGIVDVQNLMPADIEITAAGPCLVMKDRGILIGALMSAANPEAGTTLLIKLTPNGELDSSFGDGKGYVIEQHVPPQGQLIRSMQQFEDGKVVVATLFSNDKTGEGIPSLARYFADGRVDTSFNGGRLLITELPNFDAAGTSTTTGDPSPNITARGAEAGGTRITVQESVNGAILVAFRHENYKPPYIDRDYLIQITPEGALDREFQQTGYTRVAYAPGVYMQINGCKKLGDGKILLAGKVNNQGAVARLTASGALDTTFNSSGFKLVEDGVTSDLTGLFVTAGEKIRVIGRRRLNDEQRSDQFVRGYHADATDDTQFETTYRLYDGEFDAGYGSIDSTSTDNYLWCVSSVIRFSGSSFNAQSLVSRLLPNGQPDTTFGEDGYWLIPDSYFDRGFAVQNDLKCIVVTQQQFGSGSLFNVYRYLV